MIKPIHILFLTVSACSNPDSGTTQSPVNNTSSEQQAEEHPNTFSPLTGMGILIGQNVDCLNANFEKIRTCSEGTIVALKGISDSLFQKTESYCDAFHYVKVETESGEGIIDGRNVYYLTESSPDTFFVYNKKKFMLKTTHFWGIRDYDDDGLTFCTNFFEPVVLTDDENASPQLIPVMKNVVFAKASWRNNFDYLELMNNNGAVDHVEQIASIEDGVRLTIRRQFQEGWNHYQVELRWTDGKIAAEYINYGNIRYE